MDGCDGPMIGCEKPDLGHWGEEVLKGSLGEGRKKGVEGRKVEYFWGREQPDGRQDVVVGGACRLLQVMVVLHEILVQVVSRTES